MVPAREDFRGRDRGLQLVDTMADVIAEVGLMIARVCMVVILVVVVQISVGDRGVQMSYLIPDDRTTVPKLPGREASVHTAEGWP